MKSSILAIVLLYSLVPALNGQECVPDTVQNLRIDANAVLSWELRPSEPCNVDTFQVDVVGDRDDEYHFKVKDTYVDLSFLEVCEEWEFVVTPIAGEIVGYERRLTESIPLPPSADLSLAYFNVTQKNVRDVFLEWDLVNHTHGDCTLRYRVTVEDLDNGSMQDLYITGRSVHLSLLSPCVQYNLGVRAVNRAHPTIEGPMRFHPHLIDPEPEEPPRVRTVNITPTTIEMTWRLENVGRNRCPVRNLHVDGGNQFHLTIPLQDTPERPPVDVNIKDLTPDSMYFFTVSVENSGGMSQAAQIAVQTLPLNPDKK